MLSDCADCDKPAVAYWGKDAYCKSCLKVEQQERPLAHSCVECGQVQPKNVSWWRTHPCSACQAKVRT